MSKLNSTKYFKPKKSLMVVAGLMTTCCLGSFISPAYADNMTCYAIADNDRYGDQDTLVKVDASTGATTVVGPTHTTSVEASTFDCDGNQLYVVNGGVLGTLDVEAGAFSPIGTGLGLGLGGQGAIQIDDIDGLAFDCSTKKLYGTHRIEERGAGAGTKNDLLVEIDPVTGKLVEDAFGSDVDYVPVTGSQPDIDDIAWDPNSKFLGDNDTELYAIANEGVGVNSHLGNLEKTDAIDPVIGGMLTGNVVHERMTPTVNDIESLTFASDPNADGSFDLYGTTGDSVGAGTTSTAHTLYKIDKDTGGSTPIGLFQAMAKGEKPQRDFEAVACRSEIPNCLLYAVHDEKKIDSQIIQIDPFKEAQKISISLFGPLYDNVDIEGLVIVPPKPGDPSVGEFYGFSGGDGDPQAQQGAVYKITRENDPPAGRITLLGLTGFKEVSGAALQYIDKNNDGVMDATQAWGWARKGSPIGPITVALPGSVGTHKSVSLQFPPGVPSVPFPDIESIAMSNDGKILYGVQYVNKKVENVNYPNGTHLWAYHVATKKLTPQCIENGKIHPFVHAEVEGLEMQPNGLLLFVIYYQGDWGFGALDPQDCKVKATRTLTSDDYFYDIESIEWPADECRGRSWLYSGGGDAEFQALPEYVDVPSNVAEAMQQALGNGASATIGDGVVQVYVGQEHYILAANTIFNKSGVAREGERSEDCPITNAQVLPGLARLTFDDCEGSYDVTLNALPVSMSALLSALNQVGQARIEDGKVIVTLANGSTIRANLSAKIQSTGPLQLDETITAQLSPIADIDGNGFTDYVANYSVGYSQILLIESIGN